MTDVRDDLWFKEAVALLKEIVKTDDAAMEELRGLGVPDLANMGLTERARELLLRIEPN